MKGVRQHDVAERVGVTQQAVAYALSDRPDDVKQLSAETRRRIREAARQLGYVPNRAARNLRRGRTDTILVSTRSELHHPHVHEFIEALNGVLVPRGKEMLLELSAQADTNERVLATLAAGSADALVLLGYDPVALDSLLPSLPPRLPAVAVGVGGRPRISSADYDRVQATELAVSHLLEQGHRDVAMVFDLATDQTAAERLLGYRQALEKAGRPWDETLLFRASSSAPDGAALWDRLRARAPRPTAVFCYNDELALTLLQAIRVDGGRVPQDVALATLGNTRLTRLGDVPLTTVDTNYRGIAAAAVEILLKQMQDPNAPVRHVRVEPRLLARQSSGVPSP